MRSLAGKIGLDETYDGDLIPWSFDGKLMGFGDSTLG